MYVQRVCILVAEAINNVFKMNEVFNIVKNDTTAVDSFEDVVEPLAGESKISHIAERQGLSYEEEKLIGKIEDSHVGGHVRQQGRGRGHQVRTSIERAEPASEQAGRVGGQVFLT